MTDRDDQSDMFGDDMDDASILANLDQLNAVEQNRWPQRLVDLIDLVADCLMRRHQLEKDTAHDQARDIAVAIGRYFGGHQIYIPFGKELERAVRDKAIWNDFNGHNTDDLVRRYRLTKVQIYNIIARQRQLHVGRVQSQLPF